QLFPSYLCRALCTFAALVAFPTRRSSDLNRGRVSPEVAARIRQIAQEQGYEPNEVGRALARSRKQTRVGVILQSMETPTMKIVAEGARAAAKTLQNQSMEVLFRTVESVDAAQEIAYLDELLAAGVQGLAIAPVDDARVCRKLDEIAGQGIPVVTFNA